MKNSVEYYESTFKSFEAIFNFATKDGSVSSLSYNFPRIDPIIGTGLICKFIAPSLHYDDFYLQHERIIHKFIRVKK